MKRIISLMLVIILAVAVFSGCQQKENAEFKGWEDDAEALFVKIYRMNRHEVHNFIGEPSATLLNEDCEVFLKEDGEAMFVSYDECGQVEKLRSEDLAVIGNDNNAQKRYEIMNKIIGRTKENIISKYGEPDKISEAEKVLIYNNSFEVKVKIKFDDNNIAQKVSIEGFEEEISQEPEVSSKTENVNLLDDFDSAESTLMGMRLREMLDLLGEPQGYMDYLGVRAYFDSSKNCIFIKFDDERKVCEVKKYTYLEAMENQKKNRYAWLVLLMNEFIGKSKEEIDAKYNIRMISSTPRTYGYDDIFHETVYITYNKDGIAEKVSLN